MLFAKLRNCRIFRPLQRELVLVGLVLLVALILYRVQPSASVAASSRAAERGRLVFVAEGCLHCHLHYVGPNATDAQKRGLLENQDELHQQRRPVAGESRQGPDLSGVGARRSTLWLKMQLYDPHEVSGGSVMPSYAFLFRNQRGNDLVAYLASLSGSSSEAPTAPQQNWQLSVDTAAANPADGLALYNRYCATCHNADGRTRLRWQTEFIETPALLAAGALRARTGVQAESTGVDHLAQIIKLGIPNSDMAGHEYLSDRDIASLIKWLTWSPASPTTSK